MRKKILIGYADYGSGHKSVANYIKDYLENKNEFDIELINISDYGNSLGNISIKLYNKLCNKEKLYSLLYDASNTKLISLGNIKFCKKCFDNEKLRNKIKEFKPDIVVSTHFYISYIISYYNSINLTKSKIMTILTDFTSHKFWTINEKDTDYFIVQNEILKNNLIKNGIEEKKIKAFGIPVNSKTNEYLDTKENIIKKYSLSGKPIYLFFAGASAGFDYTFEYFTKLLKEPIPIDIIYICGKNKELKEKAQEYIINNNIKNALVLGFIKDVFNLINVSDVVITKPGGSTLNELIELKTPSILIPGFGGQEEKNEKFMCKRHYSVKVKNPKELYKKVKSFIKYPFIIKSMKNKLNKVNNKEASKQIYELIKKMLKEN